MSMTIETDQWVQAELIEMVKSLLRTFNTSRREHYGFFSGYSGQISYTDFHSTQKRLGEIERLDEDQSEE